MAQYDHIAYMLDCATRLKDIAHTEDTPKFFRVSGLAGMEEYLQQLNEAQYPALMVHDNTDGAIGDPNRSSNYLDNPYYVFYVIDRPEYGNADQSEAVKKKCKVIGKKILAKMLRDKTRGLKGLDFLDFSNIPYQTIGPIGDQAVGVMFSFSVREDANIIYDGNDWEASPSPS